MIRPTLLLALLLSPLLLAVPAKTVPLAEALAQLEAAPTADKLRLPTATFFNDLVVDAITDNQTKAAQDALIKLITRHFATPEQQKTPHAPTGPTLATLNAAAESALFLGRHQKAVAQKGTLRPETLRWLLQTPQRLMLVNDTFSEDDNLPESYRILEQLYDLDPLGRDLFYNLILAFAVVWDQPATSLHGQCTPLPFDADLPARYTACRDLYAKNKAKYPYKKLNPAALIFVVDTPVPLDELTWAQKNCRLSLSKWNLAYEQIKYDTPRLDALQFSWANGPYTLEAIKENGGICVDQAYYATITARANGIPAMIFTGEGRRGGHAWFSYLRGEDKWQMDVGRYSNDNYAVGQTINPQTRKPLSNHEVQFVCNKAFNRSEYTVAEAWCNLATILLAAGNDKGALALASQAAKTAKLIPTAWALQQTILAKGENKEALLMLQRQKQVAFKNMPDILLDSARDEAAILRTLGREPEAQKTLSRLAKSLKQSGRNDLAVQISMVEVNELITKKEPEKARLRLEEVLDDCSEDPQLASPLVSTYLGLTNTTGQQKEALKYLEPYLTDMQKKSDRVKNSGLKPSEFTDFLLAACTNAGDTEKEKKILKKTLKK